MTKVAQEALTGLRTVQAFNSAKQEEAKFHEKVGTVLTLARKEAIASGIFFGATGWSGNVTLLALLGYGRWRVRTVRSLAEPRFYRRHACQQGHHHDG